jgi:hypothetical protein
MPLVCLSVLKVLHFPLPLLVAEVEMQLKRKETLVKIPEVFTALPSVLIQFSCFSCFETKSIFSPFPGFHLLRLLLRKSENKNKEGIRLAEERAANTKQK